MKGWERAYAGYDSWLNRGLDPSPQDEWLEHQFERIMDDEELSGQLLAAYQEDHPNADIEDEGFINFVNDYIEERARDSY